MSFVPISVVDLFQYVLDRGDESMDSQPEIWMLIQIMLLINNVFPS